MSQVPTIRVKIVNRLGLHARPAMAFVDLAASFQATVKVRRVDVPDEWVDGKSIMQMMLLAATQHTELEVTADGADGEKACEALRRLVDAGFGED